jgi:hypothetical protein
VPAWCHDQLPTDVHRMLNHLHFRNIITKHSWDLKKLQLQLWFSYLSTTLAQHQGENVLDTWQLSEFGLVWMCSEVLDTWRLPLPRPWPITAPRTAHPSEGSRINCQQRCWLSFTLGTLRGKGGNCYEDLKALWLHNT